MAHIKKIVSTKTGKTSYRVFIKTSTKTITKTFKRKSDALAFSKTLEGNQDIQDILTHPILNQTFSDSLKEFEPTGKDEDIHYRLKYFDERIGHLKLYQIKSPHIKKPLDEIIKNGKANATRNRFLSDFGTFCKWVTQETGLLYEPHRPIAKLSEEEGKRKEYLTIEQQTKLLEQCKLSDLKPENEWKRLYLLILMALSTGMRSGELKALQWLN